MGKKLVKIFEVVSMKAGTNGRMQLAEKTGISKTTAATIDDKPDIVKKVMDEASIIIGENVEKFI